jgi:hypothetical protein
MSINRISYGEKGCNMSGFANIATYIYEKIIGIEEATTESWWHYQRCLLFRCPARDIKWTVPRMTSWFILVQSVLRLAYVIA